jgi:hypothetical protein
MGWVVNATSRSLYFRARDPVPVLQEAGWAPRLDRTGAENPAPTGIRIPNRPARSESLDRLSYPGPYFSTVTTKWAIRPTDEPTPDSPHGARYVSPPQRSDLLAGLTRPLRRAVHCQSMKLTAIFTVGVNHARS